jgi:hypothetical protein
MFLIKWRGQSKVVVAGLSRYRSTEAAEKQIAIWQRIFPANRYYIEPA